MPMDVVVIEIGRANWEQEEALGNKALLVVVE